MSEVNFRCMLRCACTIAHIYLPSLRIVVFIKVAGWGPATLLKMKSLILYCSSQALEKILQKSTSQWLLPIKILLPFLCFFIGFKHFYKMFLTLHWKKQITTVDLFWMQNEKLFADLEIWQVWETIHHCHVCTPCGNNNTNVCFP